MTMFQSVLLAFYFLVSSSIAFTPAVSLHGRVTSPLSATAENAVADTATIKLSLPKPLGMILEEKDDDDKKAGSGGVYIKQVLDSGSASPYANQILGATLLTVQGENVQSLDFDSVMEQIVNAPETVELEFQLVSAISFEDSSSIVTEYKEGTLVTLTVVQKDKADLVIETKVGENLRQVLLNNGFEVYQGLKQKIGNCGGAGQCTFCAVDFLESDGWLERSEYEAKKLSKSPTAWLSCLNSIQGPATIRKSER